MRGMLSSSFILLLGSVLTYAEDAGADSTPMHDSGLLPPPQSASALQQGGIANSPPGSAARDAYMLSDDQGLERLMNSVSDPSSGQPYSQLLDDELLQRIKQLVQQEQKRLAWNRRSYAPMFVGKKSAPMFIGKKSAPYFLGKRAVPYFVGKRAVPYFVGKKAAPMFVGKKAAPMFIGKKSAPYFLGKRAVPYFVGKKAAPYFLGRRAAPMFVGKKSVPMFVGKKSAPMFVGKKSAPMFIGKRRLADILNSMAGSNMQELSVSPLARVPSKEDTSRVYNLMKAKRSFESPLYAKHEILKRNMYPAPYFVGKRYVIPRFIGKRKEESFKDLLSALHYYEAARRYRRLVQAEKRFKAPLFVGRRSSPSQGSLFDWDTNY